MAELWLIEFAKGIGRIFLHPVFYFTFILALAAGVLRVKRERKDFHVRKNDLFHELKFLLPCGLLAGFILSIITVVAGMVMPVGIIILIGAVTLLLGIIGNARLLSPALTVGLAILFFYTMIQFEITIPFFEQSLFSSDDDLIAGVSIFLGMMIITEGMLMLYNGLKDISPKLRKSRRGLIVGALQTKRFWLLPIFCLLPVGPLSAPFEWWPVMDFGTQSYSLILLPFAIGFQQQIQSTLPRIAIFLLAKQIMGLGILIIALAIASLWLPAYMTPIVAGLAIIGRLLISYRHRLREGSMTYYFTQKNNGIMILDVIPGSPADKLGLKIGEIIQSCNGVSVQNKQDLYESLIKNRAYCKLEVFDTNGEVRLLQGALYEGEHHELGILFIEKREVPTSNQAV